MLLRPGNLFIEGVESPYSLMAASKGVYGEAAGEWTAADALGFSKIVVADGRVSPARRRARQGTPEHGERHAKRRRRQDRLGHAGLRSRRTRCASPTEIPAEEGVVVVVEVLTNKSTYNTLELTSGRMAKVGKGDIVVGALGHRKALFGYSGHVPTALQAGDVIQMLNIGGVLGICDSVNPDKGKPFDCRVLGVVLQFPVSRRAHRRAGAGRPPPPRSSREARHARRAGGGAGGHLHGGGQDRGGLRHHQPHAPSRAGDRCLQGDRRLAAPGHPRDGGCRRAPLMHLHRSRRGHDDTRATARPSRAPC